MQQTFAARFGTFDAFQIRTIVDLEQVKVPVLAVYYHRLQPTEVGERARVKQLAKRNFPQTVASRDSNFAFWDEFGINETWQFKLHETREKFASKLRWAMLRLAVDPSQVGAASYSELRNKTSTMSDEFLKANPKHLDGALFFPFEAELGDRA